MIIELLEQLFRQVKQTASRRSKYPFAVVHVQPIITTRPIGFREMRELYMGIPQNL